MDTRMTIAENVAQRTEEFLKLAKSDPLAAARHLDALADELRDMAERLRSGMRSKGGVVDWVRLQVVGPDGQVKQETEA